MSVRLSLSIALVLCATACAQIGGTTKDDPLATAGLPRYPQCEAEIKAFVALTKLAKQLGDDWRVYEPALEALQDQILDCVDDNYPDPIGI